MYSKNKIFGIGAAALILMLVIPLILFAQPAAGEVAGSDFVSRMAVLVIQLSIIIVAAWAGGVVFERFRLPAVLGEIIAGTIIGPYLLGQLPIWGFNQGLFPLAGSFPISDELYAFTTIASIVLLFLAGVETDVKTFLRFSLAGGVIGLCGVVFSFLFGTLASVLFSSYVFGSHYGFTHPVSLFLGVISTATSVSITARILSEKKKIDSPEGITIIAAAVIDDVIGIILLAVVIGMIKSGHIAWYSVAFVAAKAVGMWLGFTAAGLIFSHQLSRVLKRFKDPAVIAIMSFSGALFLAGIFEKSGLAMIIGAYVMGLSLSKTDLALVIRDKLSILHRLFVPIFFCVMGMLIDFNAMASWNILRFGLIYIMFAFVGKMLGCGIPALFLNFNLHGAMRIGMGMVPRGEVALIIAGLGLSAGLISQDIFGIAILMTFVTTLITPPVLSKLLGEKVPVLRKKPDEPHVRQEITYAMPNEETTELVLGKVRKAFEQEGYFVYCVELPDRVYQMRKNDTIISLSNTRESLIFDARIEDAVFIHTLFYEVIAEIEHLMKNLGSLTDQDKESIGKKIFANKNGRNSAESADLIRMFEPLAIEVHLKGVSKPEILEELADLLVTSGQLAAGKRDEVVSDLSERETSMSTGMQDGIALPHAKTTAVDKLIFAIGVKKEGIDFNSLDGKPSRIFLITVAPKENPQPYLQFMAEISSVLVDEQARQSILSCGSNAELYDFLVSKA